MRCLPDNDCEAVFNDQQAPEPPPNIQTTARRKLVQLGVAQTLSDLGVPLTRISAILAGKRAITADTGLRLDRCFGLSEGWWYRLETECELRRARGGLSRRIARYIRFTA